MATSFSRRDWMRASALLTGGLFATSAYQPLAAAPRTGHRPAHFPWNIWEETPQVRPDLRGLRARLLANENPWGPSSMVQQAIVDSTERGSRYAIDEAQELISQLAELEGVPEDHILLGAGSTILLEKTAIAHFLEGGNIVSPDPTYLSLIATAQDIGAEWKTVPLTANHAHDLDAMEQAIDRKTRMVYVCNPNNPTGTLTPQNDLRAFCQQVSQRVPVFVDEAYLEFLEGDYRAMSMVNLVQDGYDVVVARTFSKIHGMAGLRVGYLVAKPERLAKVKLLNNGPFGLSVTSIEGAKAALRDEEFLTKTRVNTQEGRAMIYTYLGEQGLEPLESFTSFVLFPLPVDGKKYLDAMFEQGVGVRVFQVNGEPWSRVSVGTEQQLQYFAGALPRALAV
ncbi:MAG: histidinol-phosphate transaminase [Bacteroidota bacterium]